MDETELAFAGIASQAQLIRDGEVSSRELTLAVDSSRSIRSADSLAARSGATAVTQ
jgi:hypothetical protein